MRKIKTSANTALKVSYPKFIFWGCTSIWLFSLPLTTQAYQLEDGSYEVIDTGLQYSDLHTMGILGEWLNDHLILLNATQDVSDAPLKNLYRVVLFDINTKKLTTLLPGKYFYCRNSTSHISRIKDYVTGEEKFVKINEDGNVSDPSETPTWKRAQCRMYEPYKPDRLQIFLNEGEGYIDIGKAGNGASQDNAVLYLTDKPPIELPLTGRDVVGLHHEYIPFLNEYVVARGIYQNVLMSPDGKIRRIQETTGVFNELSIGGYMYPMRDGLILSNPGSWEKMPGMFYVKGNRVIRIYGAPSLFSGPSLFRGELVSPDGCSVAFFSFKTEAYKDKKSIKIINVCKGK